MYQKVECIILKCDNCGEQFEDEHSGFSIFVDKIQANEYANNDGWHLGENHYCPKCFTVTDDDVIVVDESRTKQVQS